MKLFFHVLPFVSIGRCGLFFNYRFPNLGKLGIERSKMLLICRHVVLCEDGFNRAFRHAQGAVYAFIGVYDQEIRPLAEAVHRTDIHAVGIFALNAALGYGVSHYSSLFAKNISKYYFTRNR